MTASGSVSISPSVSVYILMTTTTTTTIRNKLILHSNAICFPDNNVFAFLGSDDASCFLGDSLGGDGDVQMEEPLLEWSLSISSLRELQMHGKLIEKTDRPFSA